MLLAPLAHAAPLGSRVVTAGGVTRVVVANRFFELTFEPARGGRCSGFRFLDNGEQVVPPDPVSGLFLDHWAKYPWPSGLMHLPYQHELVRDGDARLGVRLWVTVPAMGGGKGAQDAASSLAIPTSPDLIGLIVRKTIWLRAEQDVIEVEQEVENPTAESRGVAIYAQHVAAMSGKRFLNNWYLPSTRGVLVNVQGKDDTDRTIGPDWVSDPTAGWMAVLHRKTQRGLLFAFDYNYVEKIYTCGTTAEWFFQSVPVAPGHRFQTRYVIKPLRGFADVVHGSANLVADLRPHEGGAVVKVTSEIAAVSRALDHVTLDFTVTGWRSKAVLASKQFVLPHVGFAKVRSEFSFTPRALRDGVVIAVKAVSPAGEERYEVYYAGDQDAHDRRYNYFATQGGALAGAKGATYYRKPPRQVKPLDKPDFSKLPRPPADPLRSLVVYGLYTQMLRLDEALAEFALANAPPNAAEGFPGSYEELFGYHLVVLGDVNQKALGDIGLEMLCDWVREGGGLLVTGGPYALGNGEYEETRLLEVLPVTLNGPFDLKGAGAGQAWPLSPAAGGAALTEGVDFGAAPRVYWAHAVTPKPGAEVVLEAGGRPALVLGRYGKGRVTVLTLSPTGEPGESETAWWAWDGWPRLLRNVVAWLCPGGAR